MVTGIIYRGVCFVGAIDKTMHHRSCAESKFLVMAK